MLNNIQKLYITTFLSNLYFFAPIATLFFLSRNLSYSQIFLMTAYFMILTCFLQIPTGVLADFWSKKYTLILSALAHTIGALVFSVAHSFGLFLLAQTFWAIAVSCSSGTRNALTYATLKQESKENTSKTVFANMKIVSIIAMTVSAVIGGFIAKSDFAYTLLAFSAVLFLCIPFYFSLYEPKIKKKHRFDITSCYKQVQESFKFVFTHKIVLSFVLNSTFILALFGVLDWLWQPWTQGFNVNIQYFGLLLAFFYIIPIPFLKKIGYIEGKLGIRNLIFLSSLIPGLVFIAIAITHNLLISILGISIIFVFNDIRIPLFTHYVNEYTLDYQRVTILSIKSAGDMLIMAVLFPFFGYFTDLLSVKTMFVIVGILMIIFSFFFKIRTEDKFIKNKNS